MHTMISNNVHTMISLALFALVTQITAAGQLKVFIFAGQSNMEGQAEVATINKTSGKPYNG
jgi:hypothetical protein